MATPIRSLNWPSSSMLRVQSWTLMGVVQRLRKPPAEYAEAPLATFSPRSTTRIEPVNPC